MPSADRATSFSLSSARALPTVANPVGSGLPCGKWQLSRPLFANPDLRIFSRPLSGDSRLGPLFCAVRGLAYETMMVCYFDIQAKHGATARSETIAIWSVVERTP